MSANLSSLDVRKQSTTLSLLYYQAILAPAAGKLRYKSGDLISHSQWQSQIKIHVLRVLSMPLLHLLTHGALPRSTSD